MFARTHDPLSPSSFGSYKVFKSVVFFFCSHGDIWGELVSASLLIFLALCMGIASGHLDDSSRSPAVSQVELPGIRLPTAQAKDGLAGL